MPKRQQSASLFDAVAEALILADASDPSTLAEIVTAARALTRSAKRRKVAWAKDAEAFEAEARALPTDPAAIPEALERLGARLGAVSALVEERPPAPVPAAAPAAPAAPVEKPSGPAPSAENPFAGDEELLRDFVARAMEHLEAADEGLLVLERDPSDAEALNGVFRAFHTIKGMAGFLALTEIEQLSHATESVLEGPRRGTAPLDRKAIEAVFGGVDGMKALVKSVLAPRPAPATKGKAASKTKAAEPGQQRSGVRVDEERLDRLLDAIGELVIAEAMFSETARTDGGFARIAPQLSQLDKITRELQEMAMSLRMIPLRATFLRMARLVRDTAHKADKRIEFVTVGEDTELDRVVVDRISDPLIHLLRNAADHGIESLADRRAAGKPDVGRVELRAFHAGGRIHIEVTDDGAGLDMDAILEAARRRGLVGAEERPEERQLLDLIFTPGMSTAKTVTDVSGRGVGMDVVRRTIDSLRGEVEVKSEPGRGTRISIRLPLTLAIIDGMVVRLGTERYIVPTLSIERSLRPDPAQLSGVLGKGQVVSLGGDLIPVVPLGRLFDVPDAEGDATKAIVVVVSDNGERAGLQACELLGQQQIVIKSLGEGMQDMPGVAGGAILPDGTVGLIVDVGGLVRLARQ